MDGNPITFEIVVAIFGFIGVVYGLYSSMINNKRTDKTDSEEDGKALGIILTDIAYIKNSIDSIQKKIDKRDEDYTELTKDMARLLSAQDITDKRLDALEGKVDDLQKTTKSLYGMGSNSKF